MQVFKFGGASLKNAESIRNVGHIIQNNNVDVSFIVISALGKTTNALEQITNQYINGDPSYSELLTQLIDTHVAISADLLQEEPLRAITLLFRSYHEALQQFFQSNTNTLHTFIYDQVVSYGELLSSAIVSAYLTELHIETSWIDARDIICSDSNYTEAKVDFKKTELKIQQALSQPGIKVTQGFIARNEQHYTTTLGREGSDYTAAVIAYCTNSSKMVIWKDVPAVLNADPRIFSELITIPFLSYREAIEMTFYGAQVIHPKTIKPLQNKNIPLHVRSFIDLAAPGTIIGGSNDAQFISYPPIIVYKTNQVLITISVKDFSFIAEENLSEIFRFFSTHGLRMNLTHSGAISFNVCVENKVERIKALLSDLSKDFEVKYNDALELLTIRHYTEEKINELTATKIILLTHKTRNTIQILMRSNA